MNREIIENEKFYTMPVSTRCLYFELLAYTDENNICKHPVKVLHRGNYTQGDLVILAENGFTSVADSGLEMVT